MGFIYSQLFITPKTPTQSLAGQTAIVTGSNTGLGKEAARHIARLGAAKVILAVRNIEAGERARQDIISSTKVGEDVIQVWKLDLGSYDSVKSFAKKAESELDRIDILLENAAIAVESFRLLEGHESSVTVNVISTFFLAFLLLPKLESTARRFDVKPRLSIVSSEVHAWPKFPEGRSDKVFPALDDSETRTIGERYPTSKLLEVLVFRQVAPKIKDHNVIFNVLNPGLCHSQLSREVKGLKEVGYVFFKTLLARSTEVGSRTLVAAACAGEESHGQYMTDGLPDDGALSSFVRSAEGDMIAKKVWAELKDILEEIQAGVTNGF